MESLGLGAGVRHELQRQGTLGGVIRWSGDAAIQRIQHGSAGGGPIIEDQKVKQKAAARSCVFYVNGSYKAHSQRRTSVDRKGEIFIVSVGLIGSSRVCQFAHAFGDRGVRHRKRIALCRGGEAPARGQSSKQANLEKGGVGSRIHKVSVIRMTGLCTVLDAWPARSVILNVSRVSSSPPVPKRKRGGMVTSRVPEMSKAMPSGVSGGM